MYMIKTLDNNSVNNSVKNSVNNSVNNSFKNSVNNSVNNSVQTVVQNAFKPMANIDSLCLKDIQLKKYEKRVKTHKIPIETEFCAIIKKLCIVQTLQTSFVLCVHCVPIPEEIKNNENKNIHELKKPYLIFVTNVSEASNIESDYPEFCTVGIHGNWKLNKKNELELIVKNNNIQSLIKNNMLKNYYINYF